MIERDLTKEQLAEFFAMPGINKNGICSEAGISPQLLNNVLRGGAMRKGKLIPYEVTDKLKAQLLPVLLRYGF
jgi:hypothetical protein